MTKFAEHTEVPVERSRAEIERLLHKYGADQFMSGWDNSGKAMVAFRCESRFVRFLLPLPSQDDQEIKQYRHASGTWKDRTPEAAYKIWAGACRQRWRALCLVIKAKLEAVETGIAEFEDEFMAHIVLPDGGTVSDWARPQIAEAYQSKKMPTRLLALPAPKE